MFKLHDKKAVNRYVSMKLCMELDINQDKEAELSKMQVF